MEDHALLALKYESDFTTEWKDTAITVKTIYSDGSSQLQILGYSNDEDKDDN